MLTAWLLSLTMRPGVRYSGWRWQRVADYVRRRDDFTCRNCRRRGWTVHHVTPVSSGGSHRPGNLRTLCDDCHAEIHPWLQYSRS